MAQRLDVLKTYKLFIGGSFPRSESGRSLEVVDTKGRLTARVCQASRKDLRAAVEAARKAQPAWKDATAFLRGQILYRMAEMAQGKRDEFVQALRLTSGVTLATARMEADAAIDRIVTYAGWPDKLGQVLGSANAVAGPYYNFTSPEPVGVVGVVAPDDEPLLSMLSLMLPALASGSSVVVVASEAHPLPAILLGEVCATSDVPAGVVNLLTAQRDELIGHLADHRDIDAVIAGGLTPAQHERLRVGSAENVKRVVIRDPGPEGWADSTCDGPWWIEPLIEFKTVWHPSGT